jgi:hypothetical protein
LHKNKPLFVFQIIRIQMTNKVANWYPRGLRVHFMTWNLQWFVSRTIALILSGFLCSVPVAHSHAQACSQGQEASGGSEVGFAGAEPNAEASSGRRGQATLDSPGLTLGPSAHAQTPFPPPPPAIGASFQAPSLLPPSLRHPGPGERAPCACPAAELLIKLQRGEAQRRRGESAPSRRVSE